MQSSFALLSAVD